MSVNNVISWLRIVNGVHPKKCRFENPSSQIAFDEPWKECVGVIHINMDSIIEKEHINPFSKENILESYE